jgi:RNA polymerase sigma factor (TIGR02999 family)
MSPPAEITALLRRFQDGDEAARADLIVLVQQDLRVIAARYMRRERRGHTLQTTALVNEAYMRLVDVNSVDWRDRAHFFAVAANVMRRILVDHARRRIAGKRGGGFELLPLDEGLACAPAEPEELVKLDDALERLAAKDPRSSRVIELRFFGGLSIEESAEVLKVSPRTVKREWTFARAWLREEMGLAASHGSRPVG